MTTRWAFSRRKLIATTAGFAGGAALLEYLRRQAEPPPADWVRDSLWGENLLAYAVWDGQPRAVLALGNRINYDLMIPGDWFWPNWPPRPQWQLMGLGYAIGASSAPAIAGFAPCVGIIGERCAQPPELFGQINDANIVTLGVRIGDGWRHYPVSPPGFIVRLDSASGPPTAYRWLDAAGRVVWETESHAPTTPGSSRPYRRRRRRSDSTPGPEAIPEGEQQTQ